MSVVCSCKATLSPAVFVWLPGLLISTGAGLVIVQLKVSTAVLQQALTVIAGVYVVVVQAVLAMVPEISPVLALMPNPGGRPVSVYLSVPQAVSVADIWTETVSPMPLVWSPWSVMVIGLFTVQSKSSVLE